MDEGAVPVLHTLLSQCNRSVPHIAVISLRLSVLLNTAGHAETEGTVCQVDNWLAVLLEKMSIFREKATHVFTKAATLLVAILRDPLTVQLVLSNPKTVGQLRSLHRLVTRRHQQHQRSGAQHTSSNARHRARSGAQHNN